MKAIQPDSELPDDVQGVIVRARLDPDHWITAGVGETVTAMAAGRLIFHPVTGEVECMGPGAKEDNQQRTRRKPRRGGSRAQG